MQTIMHRIHARATLQQLYAAIATADGIRNWWTADVDMDERVGGTATLWFFDRTIQTIVRIDELAPHRRVAWEVVSCTIPEFQGTRITFDLSEAGDDVVMDFEQSGWAKADTTYRLFSSGWYLYFCSLRQYLETGKGHPHPLLDFAHPQLFFEGDGGKTTRPAIAYACTAQ